MRLGSEAQNNVAPRPLRIAPIGVDNCAISDPPSKIGLIWRPEAQSIAYLRA